MELGEGGVNCGVGSGRVNFGAVGGKRTTVNSDCKSRVTNHIHTFKYNFMLGS